MHAPLGPGEVLVNRVLRTTICPKRSPLCTKHRPSHDLLCLIARLSPSPYDLLDALLYIGLGTRRLACTPALRLLLLLSRSIALLVESVECCLSTISGSSCRQYDAAWRGDTRLFRLPLHKSRLLCSLLCSPIRVLRVLVELLERLRKLPYGAKKLLVLALCCRHQ